MLDAQTAVRTSFLDWLLQTDHDRRDWYRVYREYYSGEHSTQLTDRARKFLSVKKGEEFRYNCCAVIVDALVERLTVVGMECADDPAQGDTLWRWWQANRMDGVQSVVHRSAIRDGDAYVIVDWDEGAGHPRLSYAPAYDGTEGVEVRYVDENRGEIAYAMKHWRVTTPGEAGYVVRTNVYYPDRIEKYVSDGRASGEWRPYIEQFDSAGAPIWPLPWTMDGTLGGEPLGVPVIHFRNQYAGDDYGESELRDVVPLQNALNKTLVDVLAVADQAGFPIFWVTGGELPSGAVYPGALWEFPGEGVTVGKLEGSAVTDLMSLADNLVLSMARISQTPVSRFQASGHLPSDATLKAQDAGLVSKAKARQVYFGNSWEDALHMARRIWNAYGTGPALDEGPAVEARWESAEVQDDTATLERAKIKKEIGVSWAQVMRELGYTAAEIAAMAKERKAEQATVATAMLDLERARAEREAAAADRGAAMGDAETRGEEETEDEAPRGRPLGVTEGGEVAANQGAGEDDE